MATVEGFAIKEISHAQHRSGELRMACHLYLNDELVGFVEEQAGFLLPIVEIAPDHLPKWTYAIQSLVGEIPQSEMEAGASELFYYLLNLNEWEKLFQKECLPVNGELLVYEELLEPYGCRTGAYKAFITRTASEDDENGYSLPEVNADGEEVKWLYHRFSTLEDFFR